MNVLILGGGGREHALSWIIQKSPDCNKLYIAPGNSGTANLGINVELSISDFNQIGQFSIDKKIDIIIVGPEDPIVAGISDFFKNTPLFNGIKVLAPGKLAAQLEGSKDFAKSFMKNYHIPSAAYQTFAIDEYEKAKQYLLNHKLPVVIKADGLAAGKGVTIAFDLQNALEALNDIFLRKKFGNSGDKVVIEEYLDGIEVSVFILTDGENYVLLPEAKDYKRIGEGDTGKNTGGMGTVSPVSFADADFMEKVRERIIIPTIRGLTDQQLDYSGFIFFGLMNVQGNPYVIEYNVRLGDPEAEVILPRISQDFLPLMYDACTKNLKRDSLLLDPRSAVSIMLVSGGYPDAYEKGKVITGTEEVKESILFHAGAKFENENIVTSGGRVMAITSLASRLEEAIELSIRNAEIISFERKYFRKDIGQDLLRLDLT